MHFRCNGDNGCVIPKGELEWWWWWWGERSGQQGMLSEMSGARGNSWWGYVMVAPWLAIHSHDSGSFSPSAPILDLPLNNAPAKNTEGRDSEFHILAKAKRWASRGPNLHKFRFYQVRAKGSGITRICVIRCRRPAHHLHDLITCYAVGRAMLLLVNNGGAPLPCSCFCFLL